MSTIIKPYGDQNDDGMIQLSFTLPVKATPEGREAAIQLCKKMNLNRPQVATMESIDTIHTFFVMYAQVTEGVDIDSIHVVKLENPELNFDQINDVIRAQIGRKIVVIGACIGSDAHTVGIDAIFNMKGYAHDWGFERYPFMDAHNLRAQVDVNELAKKVVELKADAVLVSRVVTQRDEHIVELKKFLEVLKATEGVPSHLLKICGGPRIIHQEAVTWGYDAGFGTGTKPSQVGSFIAHELVKRGVK